MLKTRFSLDKLINGLKLDPLNVLNIYVVGSRLWGTGTYNSDWDFIIVLKKWKQNRSFLHKKDWDVHVLNKETYENRVLDEHRFLEVCTLWLPDYCVWKEELSLRKQFIKSFKPKQFMKILEEEKIRDEKLAKKMLNKEKYKKVEKINHYIKIMDDISKQIIKNKKITNYFIKKE